jgi:hypothetical protein
MKMALMRAVAPAVLARRGLEARSKGGKGVLPGSRLSVKNKMGREFDYAVRASVQRNLSFTRLLDGKWRTLHAMDFVLAIVPALDEAQDIEVYAFKAKALIEKFNEAWNALEKAGRSLGPQMPIFVPLDKASRRSLGHDVASLKEVALWSESFNRSQVKAMGAVDDFYERVRQEFADRVGVEVGKVDIEFRIRL